MRARTKGRASAGESAEWGAGGTLACGLQVVGAIGELTSSGAGVPPHAARLPAASLRTTPPPRHRGTIVL